jgi:hypothetical protein
MTIDQQRAAFQLDRMETHRVVRILRKWKAVHGLAQNPLNARDTAFGIEACIAVINDRMQGELIAPTEDQRYIPSVR